MTAAYVPSDTSEYEERCRRRVRSVLGRASGPARWAWQPSQTDARPISQFPERPCLRPTQESAVADADGHSSPMRGGVADRLNPDRDAARLAQEESPGVLRVETELRLRVAAKR
jgi:hypothetical protein